MKAHDLFKRALAWEKTVVLLSFAAAAALFIVIYVWGNAASLLGKANPVDLKTAGLWFLRLLSGFLLIGTAGNVIGLVIALARRVLREGLSSTKS